MELRNLSERKRKNRMIVLTVFGIAIGIRGILSLFSGSSESTTDQTTQQTLSIGQTVTFKGTLKANTNSQESSHILETSNAIYALKSDTVNLAEYIGPAYVEGTVEQITESTTLIQVTSAKHDAPTVSQETSTKAQNASYLSFLEKGLMFDTSSDNTLVIQQNGQEITIKKGADLLATIKPFVCSSQDPLQNCKSLNKADNQTQSFTSKNRTVFAKLKDSRNRFANYNNARGFMITPKDDETMVQISETIIILSADYLRNILSETIYTQCKKQGIELPSLDSLTFQNQNGLVKVTIAGNTTDGSQFNCHGEVSLGASPTFTVGTGGTKETSNATSSDPAFQNNGLVFESGRGYTLAFPTKDIIFQGFFAKEDFGILGLSCSSQINIISIKDKGQNEKNSNFIKFNAAVEIYECTTSSNTRNFQNDQTKNLIFRTSNKGQPFFIKVNDSTRKDFAEKIVIY